MSKKNIDKLFQEKFNNFNEIPDEKVWDDISHSLDKKKSRKVVPFWWRLGGVAALLAVLFVVINPFEDDNSTAPVISDTENLEKENPNNSENDSPIHEKSEKDIQLADTEAIESDNANTSDNQETSASNSVGSTKSSDVLRSNSAEIEKSQLATVDSEKSKQNKAANEIVETQLISDDMGESTGSIADNDGAVSKESQNDLLEGNLIEQNFDIEDSTKEGVANVSEEEKENEISDEGQKKSIFDEIEKQAEEEEVLAESSKNKWSVGANLAPVYFNSFGEGSPIDPALSQVISI